MSSPTDRAAMPAQRRAGRKRGVSALTRYAGLAAGVAALGLLALFVIQTGALRPSRPGKSDQPAAVEYPDQVSGANATITGFDKNRKPFAIRAARGQQDKSVKTLVHLQDVVGNFERTTGRSMDVSASAARYDTKTRKFVLEGNVVLSEGNRMKAVMETAEIDTSDQSLRSSSAVAVDMQGASIKAGSLAVSENGTRVLFKGGVKARFVTNTAPAGDGG